MNCERLYYLDNLRAVALLLGFIFHVAIVYAETIGYPIQNITRSAFLSGFCYWIHSFRMPLFFFLAGAFSRMVLNSKGISYFLNQRFFRIFIPAVVGYIFFAPIEYFLTHGDESWFRYASFLASYLLRFDIQVLSHIWFLYYLIIYSLLYLLLKFIPGWNKITFPQNRNSYLYSFVFTFSILLITHSFFSKHFHFLKLDVFLFFEYFAYFLSGTFFTPNVFKIEFMKVRKLSFFWILAFAGFLVFQDLEITDPLWAYYHGGRFWLRMNHLLLISGVGWFFIFLFVETFHRFLNQSGNVWSYLIEGALPLYLIHHPISLIIGFYLTRINTNLEYKFMIHIFGVIFFTFLIYDVMIKNSPMMRKLFGVK